MFKDDSSPKLVRKQLKKGQSKVEEIEDDQEENVAVFVHEDVADSVLRGGDGVQDEFVVEGGSEEG